MPFGSGSLKYAAVVTVVVAGDFRRCNFVNNKKVCEQQKRMSGVFDPGQVSE
jgi:hypothetical protein